jgi:LmbE family N-acetylglucosaminyl deacetylase
MLRRIFLLILLTGFLAWAQSRPETGSLRVKHGIEKLQRLGSVLMIAAHPDDENTALLAYLAQGRKMRTAYLSLTRGEGGQNLIGSEQGPMLGVIRTQELLAARRIDGAEQFFTRAIDFGFSKTADETLAKWGREKVLSDVVWVIRRFRPDVILLRFSGTPRDGHGHHQSSAILGKEAFSVAADPKRFPEQLKYVEPWQAKRVYWNVFSFNRQMEQEANKMPERIELDAGEYDPELGMSYGELAGISRSQHRSQGMGAAERRGSLPQYLTWVGGDKASKDLFDGIEKLFIIITGG